jgi:serine/threonine-protein kinase HipA
MDKEIFVYIDLDDETYLVGQLWPRVRNGRESATFEYAREWLENPNKFALEPALMLVGGAQHTPAKKAIFGALGDSAPDRWGRVLLRRAERRRAEQEKATARTLMEIDYLLLVNDYARQGALRFKTEKNGNFLANNTIFIPPLIELPKLLSATERLINEQDTDEDLRLLLAPGSSLGGARPKASIIDKEGSLAIAKFPHQDDENNTVLWEALALVLAAKAKINIENWRLENITGKPVLILRRFDRVGKKRLPYLSAMSMLGAHDNEQHSYLEIVDAIRRYGVNINENIHQLWRRIIFNILISNTDDHLRNHGFIYVSQQGWQLSPAYDLNPTPIDIKPRILTTTIDLDDGTASLDLALSVIEYFDLTLEAAKTIIKEVAVAVALWRNEAAKLGLMKAEIERMASAFEHADLEKARNLK